MWDPAIDALAVALENAPTRGARPGSTVDRTGPTSAEGA